LCYPLLLDAKLEQLIKKFPNLWAGDRGPGKNKYNSDRIAEQTIEVYSKAQGEE